MLPRIASGTLWCALLLALTAFQPAGARSDSESAQDAQRRAHRQRWSSLAEVFTGADPLLLNEKNAASG